LKADKAFGQVLKKLRNKKGISQEKLALNSDLDRTYISLLERGLRQPTLSTILQISFVLDISADKLIYLVLEAMDEK